MFEVACFLLFAVSAAAEADESTGKPNAWSVAFWTAAASWALYEAISGFGWIGGGA